MAGYSQPSGGDIGTLLRQIQEQKSTNPTMVPPGAEATAALRDTVQTPVLNPESPGTGRNVSLPGEGAGTPGQTPGTGSITPQPAMISGFGGRGGVPGWGADINMNNIPTRASGVAPTGTPVEKLSTIPIAPEGAPSPTSFVQTPGLSVGTKISAPLPVATVPGQNRAETIVSFAQKALSDPALANITTQEGQNALDRLNKIQAQLAPFETSAPAYLKQNISTLTGNISAIRADAVNQIARNFRTIPDWATEGERQIGQEIIDAINTAEAEKAAAEEAARRSSGGGGGGGGGNGGGGGGGSNSTGQSTPVSSGGGQRASSTSFASLPQGVAPANPVSNNDFYRVMASSPVPAANTSSRSGPVYTPPPSSYATILSDIYKMTGGKLGKK